MQTNTPCGSTAQPGFFALQSKHSALHARARRALSSAWTFLSAKRAASFMASVLPRDCFLMYSRCTGRRCAIVRVRAGGRMTPAAFAFGLSRAPRALVAEDAKGVKGADYLVNDKLRILNIRR